MLNKKIICIKQVQGLIRILFLNYNQLLIIHIIRRGINYIKYPASLSSHAKNMRAFLLFTTNKTLNQLVKK